MKGNDEGHDNTGIAGSQELGMPGLVCDDIPLLDVDCSGQATFQLKRFASKLNEESSLQ